MSSQWVPVFTKDGNRFLLPHKEMVADNENEAWKIGWGTVLVEGIMLAFKFSGETLEIVDGQLVHVRGQLGLMDVCLLSGPLFDAAEKEVVNEQTQKQDAP